MLTAKQTDAGKTITFLVEVTTQNRVLVMSETVFSNACEDDIIKSSTYIGLPFRKQCVSVFCFSSSLFDILYKSECMIANDFDYSPHEY